MKKKLLLPILAGLAIFIIQSLAVHAQEGKTNKVTVTITENDKVITDTTFSLREGQDPETVKEIISHILGEDVDFEGTGHKEMVWISSEGDKHTWHAEEFEFDFDSIGEEEGDVMVFEDEDDNVHKVIVKKQKSGDEDIIVMSSKTIRVSEEDGKVHKTIIIEESGDNKPEGKEKRVKVIVESDDDVKIISEDDPEWVEEDEEDVDVYIIKKDDNTKVIKKVKVEVKEVDEDEETPAPVKEKEKKK
jgi:hypothetical protein